MVVRSFLKLTSLLSKTPELNVIYAPNIKDKQNSREIGEHLNPASVACDAYTIASF